MIKWWEYEHSLHWRWLCRRLLGTISADSGHDTLVLMLMPKIAALGSGDRDTIEGCLFEDGLGDCWFAILIGFVLPLITAMRRVFEQLRCSLYVSANTRDW